VKALLLAAGLGTRMRGAFGERPKILAPLGGRTLLDHQLDYLAANGVTEVAVNVHHQAAQVLAALEGRDVRVSVEEELLGTAGALLPLRDFLDEPFVVLYGDVVTGLDLRSLRLEGIATLACYRGAVKEKGVLEVEDGRVVSFVEKGGAGEGLVNAGIYLLDPAIHEFVGEPPSDFGHDVFPRALAAGARITAQEIDAWLQDVGTPEALALAEAKLAAWQRSRRA
jgi:NDP-sugar pyrophosphorylase family protein